MNVSFSFGDSTVRQESGVSVNQEQATSLLIRKARQLVTQLIGDRGCDKPPFSPSEYARLQNIKVVNEDLGEVSAVLLRFHDGPVIKVNQNHSPVRQNFSCAHEIGHVLLRELQLYLTEDIEYRTFNLQAQGEARSTARELLCDAAAAELLMPEFVFRKYLSAFGVSINSIERLANIFRVSILSAAIRIAEVSPEPCLALLWKPWPRNRPKGLRFAVPRKNLRGKTNYMPLHTLAKSNSTLYRAYQHDSPIKSWKLFKVDNATKRLPMESRGFSHGETRYVISLAFLDR